jgi:hypothetical protein
VRRTACAAMVARWLSRHNAAATVRKKSWGLGVGVLAVVQEVVLDRVQTGGMRQRLMVALAGEDGWLRCSGAA